MDAPTYRWLLLANDLHNTVLAGIGPFEAGHMAYTAYGAQPGPAALVSRSGFNGQFREQGTGWYLLGNGHRIYNPALMRFHSPDALSPFDRGGLNAYTYCLGDPVNHVDPTGRTPDWLQPALTISLHAFTIAATVIAAAVAGPPVGAALVAARMTLTGSSLAIAASSLTLAGVKEARYVAHAGTAISALGAVTRVGLGVQSLVARKELRATAAKRLGHLFGMEATTLPKIRLTLSGPRVINGTPVVIPTPFASGMSVTRAVAGIRTPHLDALPAASRAARVTPLNQPGNSHLPTISVREPVDKLFAVQSGPRT